MTPAAPDMVTTACPTLDCGVPFSVPTHVYEQTQRVGEKRKVYCPNGHVVIWSKTNEDRLREQVEQLEKERDGLRSLTYSQEDEIEKAERSIRYWRGWAKHWKARARR